MNGLNIPTALRVARKDIKILLKERGTLIYLFVLPILFITAFGSAAGLGSVPQEKAISLPVVNLDAGSGASQTLLDALNQGDIQCELYGEARAQALLDKGEIDRVLTIPASYAADLQAGRPVALRLVNGPEANPTRTEAVYRVIAGVTADLSLETQLIASLTQMVEMQAAGSPEQQAFTVETIVEQAQSQFARSRTDPLLGLEEIWAEHLLGEEEEISPLSVYVPGFAVLFVFLTAQTTAQSIYDEKKLGSFRRLQAAPINKVTILVGKMVPNFTTGLAQTIVLLGAGLFVLPAFGLDSMTLGNDPLALVLVCLVVLLCSTCLGVFIAAIARTEAQISGLSQVLLWVFGFAGIWMDQMSFLPLFDTISKAIPHCWANTAFLNLFIRGQGLADVLPSIWALLGFSVAFFAIGLRRFDYRRA